MAQKVQLVVQILDGRHQRMTPADARFQKSAEGGWAPVPHRTEGNNLVADLTADMTPVQFRVRREQNALEAFFLFDLATDGKVTKSSLDPDYRIRNQRTAGDTTIAEIDVVLPRVTVVDPKTSSAFFTAGGQSFWDFKKESILCLSPITTVENDPEFKFGGTGQVQPDVQVFYITHLDRPKLIGVATRSGFTQVDRMLLFYHHTVAQNGDAYKGKGYPWSEAYVRYGLFAYFGGERALAYQLAASGKNLALVIPVPQYGLGDDSEIGVFDSDPTVVSQVLEEIIATYNRKHRNDFSPPRLKELAIGHYSGGILHTKKFLPAAGSLKSLITEVYDIDGLYSSYGRGMSAASFAATGRIVRSYVQTGVNIDPSFKSLASRNSYVINFDRWKNLPSPSSFTPTKGITVDQMKKQWVHSVVPGAMLLHALMNRT